MKEDEKIDVTRGEILSMLWSICAAECEADFVEAITPFANKVGLKGVGEGMGEFDSLDHLMQEIARMAAFPTEFGNDLSGEEA